jgi:hypothetical protein
MFQVGDDRPVGQHQPASLAHPHLGVYRIKDDLGGRVGLPQLSGFIQVVPGNEKRALNQTTNGLHGR